MLAIYSDEVIEEGKGLYFAVGSYPIVNSTFSKLRKKIPAIKELLKINSESSSINNFKHKLKAKKGILVRKHFIESMEDDSDHKKNLLAIIMNLFLECHSCTGFTIQICKDCQRIVKFKENKYIGEVLAGMEILISCLNWKKNWFCKECRPPSEFALIAWGIGDGAGSGGNYAVYVGPRDSIERRVIQIRRGYADAQLILCIRPSLRDAQVGNYIKHKFMSIRPFQICDNNMVFYQEFILESFLNFFNTNYETNKQFLRICNSCTRVFLEKGEKDLGEVILINKKEMTLLHEISPYWLCSKCEKSLLILYALECTDGSLDYYIVTNNSDRKALSIHKKRYTRIYPCFKFLCSHLNVKLFKYRITQMKNLSVHGNIIRTKLSRQEFLNMIYNKHFCQSFKRVRRLNLRFSHFQVCGDCGRAFYYNINNLGACWSDTALSIQYCKPRHFYCLWHYFTNILYWNIEACNSLNNFELREESIFLSSDIVCIFGNCFINNADITGLNFLRNRFVISDLGLNATSGKERSRFMILLKKDIIFIYEKLSYSSKGLFVKIEHGRECTVIGVVHWPQYDQPSDSITDWLLELKDILNKYNKGNTKFILGGNFNCRVGNLNNGFKDESVFWNGKLNVQRSLDTERDKRGELLADLMMAHDFILCNGRTASDYPAKFTYENGNHQIVSDLVWVNQNSGYCVKDMAILKLHDENMKLHYTPFPEFNKPPD